LPVGSINALTHMNVVREKKSKKSTGGNGEGRVKGRKVDREKGCLGSLIKINMIVRVCFFGWCRKLVVFVLILNNY
jgi:hypothetical protein